MVQPLVDMIIVERHDEQHPAYSKMEERVAGRRDGTRRRRPNADLLDAIKHLDHLNVATRILHAAVSLLYDPTLGRSEKSGLRSAARLIGSNLDQNNGSMAFRVGHWAIQLLKEVGFEEENGDLDLPLIEGVNYDQLMTDTTFRNAFRSPYILPTPYPPRPWTGFRKGGIPNSEAWARPELIITHGKKDVEVEVRRAMEEGRMRPFLDAVNYLQNVAFAINEPVLNWVERYGPLALHGFTDVASYGPPPPVKKTGEKRDKWWPGSDAYIEIEKQRTFDIAIREARDILRQSAWCYVPLHADTRGRLYAIPHFSFTREDYIRGLFLFYHGERIGEDGLLWLKAHVAKCADGWNGEKTKHFDLEGRAAWTEANIERLYRIAEAVERCERIPKLHDEGVQFLAACLELKRADNNPDFITHLPVTFDGTCSGLQHLSALTRCENEGSLANLVPSDKREDLYQVVADMTSEERKVAKKPCVSFFYGSAPGYWTKSTNKDGKQVFKAEFGMIKEMLDFLRSEKMSTKNVTKRVRAIHKAIKRTIPQACKTQIFLRKLAKVCTSNGRALSWFTTLPVINFYYEPIIKRTDTRLGRSRKQANQIVGYNLDKITPKAHTAAAANFVHSLDAAHMHMVANAAAIEGIVMVGVHDSFSCLASRARRFHQIIGEQFRDLHQTDWLRKLLKYVRRDFGVTTTLELPEHGTLELDDVPSSFFAYS